LEFHRPPKIPGNPPPHKKDKYFNFHGATGQHTKGCIALRLLIEKFIKNGKLVWFLGEQRNQLGNDGYNRCLNCQDYQPRDCQPWDYQPREYQPRDLQSQDYQPRDPPRHNDRRRDNASWENKERRDDQRRERSQSQRPKEPRHQRAMAEGQTISRGLLEEENPTHQGKLC